MGTTNFDTVDLSGALKVDNVQVVSNQQAAIVNASTAHALNATFSDVEAETALNALGTKINSVLAVLRAHGLIVT